MNDEVIWVCHACGKTATSRDGFSDSSCRTWATLCYKSSLVYGDSGLVKLAQAVPERTEAGGVDPSKPHTASEED